jgi:hypothetical protein
MGMHARMKNRAPVSSCCDSNFRACFTVFGGSLMNQRGANASGGALKQPHSDHEQRLAKIKIKSAFESSCSNGREASSRTVKSPRILIIRDFALHILT